ncbi:MAG: class I SAM-dependent methyltransferase [Candidatus Thermoplasmatota archaeon]
MEPVRARQIQPTLPQAPVLQVEVAPACPVCAVEGSVLHEGVPDGFGITANAWSFRRCPSRPCGHVWLDPAPTAGDLPRAYDAYPVHGEDAASPAGAGKRSLAGNLYRVGLGLAGVRSQRARLETFRLPPGNGGRLLEVGCGNGARLASLAALGYEVEGQDVAPAAVAVTAARGRTVHHGELARLGLPDASYDVIVMNHVLEHVRHSVDFLRQAHRLLRPGGRLVSIQPNAASRGHRAFGADWVGLDPPRHLHVFTPKSVRAVAQAAGFRDVRVATTAVRREHWTRDSLRRRAARTGAPAVAGLEARASLSQLAGLLSVPFAPDAGDEIVLEARR